MPRPSAPVRLLLPFNGKWLAQNSPLRRVPSHGTELLAQSHAIDFVGVDDAHRSAPLRDWRTMLATEPPERFFAFGRPILAPGDAVVVENHDGEEDHPARRSQLALVPYMLG
ncbi:MAG: M23 family peptidase, partial [Specibacter sp.]